MENMTWVSAADKGWRAYPLYPHPDAVSLYSGCTLGKRRPWYLLDDRHTASLAGLRGVWRHARMKLVFNFMDPMLLCPDSPLTVIPHRSLNSCRGVVSEPYLLCASETEVLEGLSDQCVTQIQLLPSTSSVTVTSSSESQPSVPLVITTFSASNSSSTSAASTFNKALSSSKVSMFRPLPAETCPVVETSTTISKTIPSAPQTAKQTSRNHRSDCIGSRCWDQWIREISFMRRPDSGRPRQTSRRKDCHIWFHARGNWSAAEWYQVDFSDESRFNLSRDDNRVRVWRPRGERLNPAFALKRHTAPTAGVMVCGAIAYNTRSPPVLIRGTMKAQWYVHDILQTHVLPGAIFNKTTLGLTRQGCHKTVSALLLPILGLPDPQIYLQSSISGIIWDGELGIPRVCTNQRQGYSKYGTKCLKTSYRTCMPQCLIVSHLVFALEGVQQGIKPSVLLLFSLKYK
ncbi:transposable element Tcb2 transposase [Trichonephila clavipes]|nr:transposable element Tcb2 transposase [Trichonephila clavipes]